MPAKSKKDFINFKWQGKNRKGKKLSGYKIGRAHV